MLGECGVTGAAEVGGGCDLRWCVLEVVRRVDDALGLTPLVGPGVWEGEMGGFVWGMVGEELWPTTLVGCMKGDLGGW